MKQLMSQVVTVLSASRYSFQDENDKSRWIAGCKVLYVFDWDGDLRQNSKGLDIMSATLDIDEFELLCDLPGDYDASFSSRKGRKGALELHVDSLKFVAPFVPYKSAHVSPNDEHGKAK